MVEAKEKGSVLVMWNIFYCTMILIAKFGDCSNSFYVFFKVMSLIHFLFYALAFFAFKTVVSVMLGAANIGLVVFFIDSFTRYHRYSFWESFDVFLLIVVVVQFWIPTIMLHVEYKRKIEWIVKFDESLRHSPYNTYHQTYHSYATRPEIVNETINKMEDKTDLIQKELPECVSMATKGQVIFAIKDEGSTGIGVSDRKRILDALYTVAERNGSALFKEGRPTELCLELSKCYATVAKRMVKEGEISLEEGNGGFKKFESKLLGYAKG